MLLVDWATLFVFHQIADLSLHLNQLTSVIPAELDQLSNLEQFSFRGDRLTGSVPSAVSCALTFWAAAWPGWRPANPSRMPSAQFAVRRGESVLRRRSATWERKRWW